MKKITSIVLGLMVVLPLSVAPAFASSDTIAPSRPLALNALIASASQINLSWTASTDNVGVTGYNIYNKNVLIGTSTSTNFVNTGLTLNTKYKYKVVALDAAGNRSHKSKIEVITLVSPDVTAPSIPVALMATVMSSKQINLNWSNSKDNVKTTAYNIYRNNVLIATSSKSMFQDTSLASSTLYTYRISALDAAGNVSAQSVVITATTLALDTVAPSTPTLLTAIINFKNKVMLSWTAAADNVGVTEYNIIRNGNLIGTSKDTKYVDNTVATSTAYTYSVIALDADGNTSATSSVALITTPATTTPIKKDCDKLEHKDKKENIIKNHKINDNKKLDQHDSNHKDSDHNDSNRNGKN